MGSLIPADCAACSAADHPINSSVIKPGTGKPTLDFHDNRAVCGALVALIPITRVYWRRAISVIGRGIVAIVRVRITERSDEREASVKEDEVPETKAIIKIVETKPVIKIAIAWVELTANGAGRRHWA